MVRLCGRAILVLLRHLVIESRLVTDFVTGELVSRPHWFILTSWTCRVSLEPAPQSQI
jgi:hypothetical protein